MAKPYHQDKWSIIYHGDCRDVLPQLEPVDLVLTDPPYGIGIARNGTVGVSVKAPLTHYGNQSWDEFRPDKSTLDLVIRLCRNAILFGGNYFADLLPPSKCWIIWDKRIPKNYTKAHAELAWTNFTTYTRHYSILWHGMIRTDAEPRCHPTQKPVKLMKSIIRDFTRDSDIILDPFMGSGSTLVAAKALGRRAIGVEIEEKYCEIAADRLRQDVFDFEAPES